MYMYMYIYICLTLSTLSYSNLLYLTLSHYKSDQGYSSNRGENTARAYTEKKTHLGTLGAIGPGIVTTEWFRLEFAEAMSSRRNSSSLRQGWD
jgi:hypothetical protein